MRVCKSVSGFTRDDDDDRLQMRLAEVDRIGDVLVTREELSGRSSLTTASEISADFRSEIISFQGSEISLEENQDDAVFSINPASVKFSNNQNLISVKSTFNQSLIQNQTSKRSTFNQSLIQNQTSKKSTLNQNPAQLLTNQHLPEDLAVDRENDRNLGGEFDDVNLVCVFKIEDFERKLSLL